LQLRFSGGFHSEMLKQKNTDFTISFCFFTHFAHYNSLPAKLNAANLTFRRKLRRALMTQPGYLTGKVDV